MKKILVTLSLICFIAFVSSAQTTPTATSKETKTEAVKTDASASASTNTKKSGCCHKGMSSADCKSKSAKNGAKAGADSKAEKNKVSGAKSN